MAARSKDVVRRCVDVIDREIMATEERLEKLNKAKRGIKESAIRPLEDWTSVSNRVFHERPIRRQIEDALANGRRANANEISAEIPALRVSVLSQLSIMFSYGVLCRKKYGGRYVYWLPEAQAGDD